MAAGVAVAAVLAVAPLPAAAGGDRQVVLVITQGRTYEQVLRDPVLGPLRRAGGIGLMTTAGGAESPVAAAVSLGAGRAADGAPPGPVPFDDAEPGLVVDAGPYRAAAGPARAGLLGSALAEAGRTVGYLDLRGTTGHPAMLTAMDAGGRIPVAFLNEFPTLGELPPEFLGAPAGEPVDGSQLLVTPDPSALPFVLERTPASEVLVLAVVASASEAMREEGDTVTPVVLARGRPAELLAPTGAAAGLTSDTTRRDGLISNVDVAPTVLEFLGVPVPGEMVGSPAATSGRPPTELHRRALEWRAVVAPVGIGVLAFALATLLTGLVLAFGPWSTLARARDVVAVAGLGSVAMLVMLLPAALLPSFDPPLVLAAIAGGAAILTAAALRVTGGRPTRAVATVAAAGVFLVALDALLGWPTGLTPFLGGSALDGERFFGLGNPYAGMVLGGATLLAGVAPVAGTAVLVAAALFAGLPFLGADLGGGLTLALAAGLWLGLARWGRLGWRTWAVAAGALVAGLVVLVAAHEVLPPGTTHVSRAVEGSGGPLGLAETYWRRLLLNLETTSDAPAIWLALAGLPAGLALALQAPGPLREVLAAEPRWRHAAVVLALAGIAGYLLNDTYGTAAVAFVFLSAALVYPALRGRTPGTTPPGG